MNRSQTETPAWCIAATIICSKRGKSRHDPIAAEGKITEITNQHARLETVDAAKKCHKRNWNGDANMYVIRTARLSGSNLVVSVCDLKPTGDQYPEFRRLRNCQRSASSSVAVKKCPGFSAFIPFACTPHSLLMPTFRSPAMTLQVPSTLALSCSSALRGSVAWRPSAGHLYAANVQPDAWAVDAHR